MKKVLKRMLIITLTGLLFISMFSVFSHKAQAFSNPYILNVGISYEDYSVPNIPPITQTPGGIMRLWYHLYNPNSYPVDVILGASIQIGSNTYDDPAHDVKVTLKPGDSGSWPNRWFYVPLGVPSGTYNVIFAIWSPDRKTRYDLISKSGWINMIDSAIITLSSSPSNVGTITWDGVTHNLPKTIYTTTRTHVVQANPPAGYEFDHWEYSGNVSVYSVYAYVHGHGSIKAVFNTTIQAPTQAPNLISPSNGATLPAGSVTFSWSSVSGATSYELYISGPATYNITKISGTSYTLSLSSSGSYTWKVRGYNSAGYGPWSTTWSFTIQTCAFVRITNVEAPDYTAYGSDVTIYVYVTYSFPLNENCYIFIGIAGAKGWIAKNEDYNTVQYSGEGNKTFPLNFKPYEGEYDYQIYAFYKIVGGEWIQCDKKDFILKAFAWQCFKSDYDFDIQDDRVVHVTYTRSWIRLGKDLDLRSVNWTEEWFVIPSVEAYDISIRDITFGGNFIINNIIRNVTGTFINFKWAPYDWQDIIKAGETYSIQITFKTQSLIKNENGICMLKLSNQFVQGPEFFRGKKPIDPFEIWRDCFISFILPQNAKLIEASSSQLPPTITHGDFDARWVIIFSFTNALTNKYSPYEVKFQLSPSNMYLLHVQSKPVDGVLVSYSGDFSGASGTNFDIGLKEAPFTVTLKAPLIHGNYKFSHWLLDGVNMGQSNTLTVKVDDEKMERTAVAVYSKEVIKYTLHVKSEPITGVSISYSGDYSGTGTTNFDIGPKDSSFTVTLTAPLTYQDYAFDHWELDGENIEGSNAVTVKVDYKKNEGTAVAHYVSTSKPFIAELRWNREPPIASLNSIYYSEGVAKEHGMYIWWDDYYLEGIYAYVTIKNPTNSKFSIKIIWNLIGPDGSTICSETLPGALSLKFVEIEAHETKIIKLFIRDTRTFPSILSPGEYKLEVKLGQKTGLTSYEVIDTRTSSIKLVSNKPAVNYPSKDVDGDGDAEPVIGNVFSFFDASTDKFSKLSDLQKAIVIADILLSWLGIITMQAREPQIAYSLLAESPALQTAKVSIIDKGLQETKGSLGVKILQVNWWNLVHYPKQGIAKFIGANYDRAIIILKIPNIVDIIDSGGANLCWKDDNYFYLAWIETGVDKLIKPSGTDEYILPEPNGKYLVKIEPKPWNQIKKINVEASVTLQFGPFEEIPSDTRLLVYNYTKWIERPEDVYWGVVGLGYHNVEIDIPTIKLGNIIRLDESQHKLYLHVYDEYGQHLGVNYKTGTLEKNIPNSSYYDLNNGTIIILLLFNVTNFKVLIDAKFAKNENESYNLTLITIENYEIKCQKNIMGNIRRGETRIYDVQISQIDKLILITPEISWWVQHQLWIVAGVIGSAAILTISVALIRRRKKQSNQPPTQKCNNKNSFRHR